MTEEKQDEIRIVLRKTPSKETAIEVEGRWTIEFPKDAKEMRELGEDIEKLGEKIKEKAKPEKPAEGR